MNVTLNEVPIPSIYSINGLDGNRKYYIIPINGRHKEISETEYNEIKKSKFKLN